MCKALPKIFYESKKKEHNDFEKNYCMTEKYIRIVVLIGFETYVGQMATWGAGCSGGREAGQVSLI